MKALSLLVRAATCVALSLIAFSAVAADYPTPQEGDWVARDFRFHTGEVMPDLRLHYTTVGAPSGQPVLILHGTSQSGTAMLSPVFAAELFGPGQPLDASKYYIILPDIIGHGKSAKPSDGLRTKFPHYNYDDMVAAQYRLVGEGLGLRHLRLVLGFSMGGMQTWVWGVKYPDFMDALVPMASLPAEMSSRNWMMRRLITDGIGNDPEWNNGNYMVQPRAARINSVFYGIATNGGTLAYQKSAPTREAADKRSTTAWLRPLRRMPTTFFTNGTLRATITPHLGLTAFRLRSWRSIRRTTRKIRRKPESWSVNLSA